MRIHMHKCYKVYTERRQMPALLALYYIIGNMDILADFEKVLASRLLKWFACLKWYIK